MCIHSIEKEDDRKAPRAVATGKPNYKKKKNKEYTKRKKIIFETPTKYSQQISKQYPIRQRKANEFEHFWAIFSVRS